MVVGFGSNSCSTLISFLRLLKDSGHEKNPKYKVPGSLSEERSIFRRLAGRVGLDYIVAGFKFANRQLGKLSLIRVVQG